MEQLQLKEANYGESLEEREFYNRRSFDIRLYKGSVGMGREVLSAAVFRVGRGERQQLDFTTTSARGTPVRYRGQELRQDDERVLEFLIHATRNKVATCAIDFNAMDFVEAIGWDRHKRSVEKLDESLDRMQGARLAIGDKSRCVSVQLVGKVVIEGDQRTVWLHEDIVQLFEGGCTYRPLEERRALPDGIASWLGGFLRANSDEDVFSIADMHRHSGSAAGVHKFQESLRDAALKLEAVGAVASIEFKRGCIRVKRTVRPALN